MHIMSRRYCSPSLHNVSLVRSASDGRIDFLIALAHPRRCFCAGFVAILAPVKLRRILLSLGLLVLAAGGVMAWQIGPSNIIGMLLYDQRREGSLKVGDLAPDVALERLEGGSASLAEWIGGRPLVLVFGSFT